MVIYRATSTTNVALTSTNLTRRSSERDISDGSKKRATSASGLDRKHDGKFYICFVKFYVNCMNKQGLFFITMVYFI